MVSLIEKALEQWDIVFLGVIIWFCRCSCEWAWLQGNLPSKDLTLGYCCGGQCWIWLNFPWKSIALLRVRLPSSHFPLALSMSSLPEPHLFSLQSFGSMKCRSAELWFLDDKRRGFLFSIQNQHSVGLIADFFCCFTTFRLKVYNPCLLYPVICQKLII